ALATILITAINIVAGLLIGTLQQGIALGEAVRTYTILTVGDGLVTMIPSLLVSVAGGMVLTRASSAGQLTTELGTQLLGKGTTLYVASGVLGGLCLIPGLPKLVFLLPAVVLGYLGRRVAQQEVAPADAETAKKAAEKPEALIPSLKLDDLSLEIGFQLIPLVDEKQGGQMLGRVKTLRRHLAQELGFLIPPVHISDNLRLRAREYVVSLRGIEIGRWQTEGTCLLAVSTEARPRPLPGKEVREPAYGAPARWIQPALEEEALAAGYSVVDQGTLIGTHLAELIRKHAHELLGRAETKRLLDSLGESHPKLVEELVPKVLSLGEVQRVLQQLLRERVSIRDLGTVLEALVETAGQNRSLPALVEAARQALGRRLTQPLVDAEGTLRVIAIEPALEEELLALVSPEASARQLAGSGSGPVLKRLTDSLKTLMGSAAATAQPVLLCASPARYHLRRWLEPVLPRLTVIAPGEIPPEVPVRAVGVVRAGA
ncbi:MAG: FHIPEP family type III secretion protein, partial [Acidobacteriota bacterium]